MKLEREYIALDKEDDSGRWLLTYTSRDAVEMMRLRIATGCPHDWYCFTAEVQTPGSALSRTAARAKVTARELRRQMEGVWYDFRLSDKLRDEAPAAYKDIKAVLRAQRELVKVTRVLRPILNYKGT